MASIQERNFYTKPKTDPVQEAYNNAGTTVRKQAGDYDDIMGRFRNVYDSLPTNGMGAGGSFQFNYTKPTYENTQDYLTAMQTAKQRAAGGTYSAQDQADIRERGISPIRSVYANAQRNLNRSKNLAGYSPNYAAVSAKMAREMSSQLSDATTRVNAQLAQDVAGQKEHNQSEYLSSAGKEQGERNQFNLNAADMDNKYGLSKLDAEMKDFYMPTQLKLSSLGGMTGLFGTTPGFSNMMNNQANTVAGIQANANQNNTNNQLRLMQMYGGQ